MQIGVVLPSAATPDLPTLRGFVHGAESAGVDYIAVYDHVVGADRQYYTGWRGRYSLDDPLHEPMVVLGCLAALTSLGLATTVLVMPQRQTALVAKQAAEIDLISGGRFRLGVGIGWNEVEYQTLGMSFADRARRLEEQVSLLRRFWTQSSVTYSSASHSIVAAGINPPPRQRPIPVWIGAGFVPAALSRVGRLADGWVLRFEEPGDVFTAAMGLVRQAAGEAGRDPERLGLEARVLGGGTHTDHAIDVLARWQECGATHAAIDCTRSGLRDVDEHLAVLDRIRTSIR
jgi:probable F420-dependent oxidoreductase